METQELLGAIADRLDGRATAPADVISAIDTLVVGAWGAGVTAPRPHPDDAPVLLERLAALALRRAPHRVRRTAASRLVTGEDVRDLAPRLAAAESSEATLEPACA